jgi:hypothetical protein
LVRDGGPNRGGTLLAINAKGGAKISAKLRWVVVRFWARPTILNDIQFECAYSWYDLLCCFAIALRLKDALFLNWSNLPHSPDNWGNGNGKGWRGNIKVRICCTKRW